MKKTICVAVLLILFSPIISHAGTYTLSEFVDMVEANSRELKIAEKEIEKASAQKKQALSSALPNISAQAGYNRYLSDAYMYINMGEGTQKMRINRTNEYEMNVGLRQTLFNLNVLNAIKVSGQYQRMIDYTYESNHLAIITNARKGFYQALLLKTIWEVTEKSQQNAYDNYLDVQKKYNTGLVSEFNLLQAEARWKDMIPHVSQAKMNYDLALISLKNLAGIPPEEEIELQGSLEEYPDMPSNVEFHTILEDRPDYNALIWQKKLMKTNINAERSGYFPSLSGNLVYSFTSQSDEWAFDDKNEIWIAGLTLSIPIFMGGGTRAKVKQATVEYQQTELDIDRTEDEIFKEIQSIRLRLNEASERINSARASMNTAEKAFRIAEVSARNGLATQLELKDARVVLDQAQVNYYSSIYQYLDAYFDWQNAIGGE